MADGAQPAPGGWNRIHLIFDDLDAEIERLRAEGVPFRNDVVVGPGGDTEVDGVPELKADVDVFGYIAERHPAIGYLEFDRTHGSPPGQLGRYPLIP